jgi:hypothetical protein
MEYLAHAAARPLRGLTFQRAKSPIAWPATTREDAGSLSFRARCRCSRIGAGHWRCCASQKMVRGNDELSSCNQADQTMTCRWQGDMCSRPLHSLQASVTAGNANWMMVCPLSQIIDYVVRQRPKQASPTDDIAERVYCWRNTYTTRFRISLDQF